MRDVYIVAHLPENLEQVCVPRRTLIHLWDILLLVRSSLVLLGRMLVLTWHNLACGQLVL